MPGKGDWNMADNIKIDVSNLQSSHAVNEPLLEKVLSQTMREAGVSGTLSVAVVDSEEITELNRRFLGRAQPTDVLSFPMQDGASDLFGEIVICSDIAAKEAADRNISFDAELTLYAVHGLLHLLGYDDEMPQQRERMHRREREILALVGAGMRNREIAAKLFISKHTVKAHLRNILEKLRLHSRQEATVLAIEEGLPTQAGKHR